MPYPDEPTCQHSYSAIRGRVQSNGVEVCVKQCLDCGVNLGAVKKLPPAELALLDRFDEALRERWDAKIREYWATRRAYNEQQYQTHNTEWWANYNRYLLTAQWRERRDRVLDRDNGMCQARLDGCVQRAITAHHLSYEHVGNEPLFELVAICAPCHEQLHPQGLGNGHDR